MRRTRGGEKRAGFERIMRLDEPVPDGAFARVVRRLVVMGDPDGPPGVGRSPDVRPFIVRHDDAFWFRTGAEPVPGSEEVVGTVEPSRAFAPGDPRELRCREMERRESGREEKHAGLEEPERTERDRRDAIADRGPGGEREEDEGDGDAFGQFAFEGKRKEERDDGGGDPCDKPSLFLPEPDFPDRAPSDREEERHERRDPGARGRERERVHGRVVSDEDGVRKQRDVDDGRGDRSGEERGADGETHPERAESTEPPNGQDDERPEDEGEIRMKQEEESDDGRRERRAADRRTFECVPDRAEPGEKQRDRQDRVRAAQKDRGKREFRDEVRCAVRFPPPCPGRVEPERMDPARADAREREDGREARIPFVGRDRPRRRVNGEYKEDRKREPGDLMHRDDGDADAREEPEGRPHDVESRRMRLDGKQVPEEDGSVGALSEI